MLCNAVASQTTTHTNNIDLDAAQHDKKGANNRRCISVSVGHISGTHDSTAFKDSQLYRNRSKHLTLQEYLLADIVYALERHVVVPYKAPCARERPKAAFNYMLLVPRVKIEHAFSLLKAGFPSLKSLPVRVRADQRNGHQPVIDWVTACLVLHNMLNSMKGDEQWLEID